MRNSDSRRPDSRFGGRRIDRHRQRGLGGGPPAPSELVYGVEPVRELLAAAPSAVRALYVRAGDDARFADLIERVRAAGGRIAAARDDELDRLAGAGARHQGIIAELREDPYQSTEAVLADKPDPVVLVDGVTDPRNLGALLRSAEGAGVRAVILARDRTASINPAAIKASAGAWAHLKVARCGNVARTLDELKDAGYWIVALAPGGGVSLYELDTARKLAIVVGSEERGVREIVKKRADYVVGIPMKGRVQSLNVSVAAAVALFEIARRRAASKGTT